MQPLILFDIDLTLIRTSGAGRNAMGAAFEDLYGVKDAARGIRVDGRTDRAIFLELLEQVDVFAPDAEAAYQRVTARYLEYLPATLAASSGVVLPGVADLLDACRASGAPLGLATGNIRDGAALKLRHFGLWERFAAGGFGDHSVDRSEVVREAIRALAAASGLVGDAAPPCIVVGDTPLDCAAAHAAGAMALCVATGSYTMAELRACGADIVVPDLTDTAAVLRILAGE